MSAQPKLRPRLTPPPRSGPELPKPPRSKRAGVAFLMVIFVTALVVMAFTQTALRSVINERFTEQQRQTTSQLETALECTDVSVGANRPDKITLPLDMESGERIEVTRDGKTITARWMNGDQERASLTRTEK